MIFRWTGTWSRVLPLVLSVFTACSSSPETPTPEASLTAAPTGTPTNTPSIPPTPTPVSTPCPSTLSATQSAVVARQAMANILVDPRLMPYFLNHRSASPDEWQARMNHYVECLTRFLEDGGVPLDDPTCDIAKAGYAVGGSHIQPAPWDFDAYLENFRSAVLNVSSEVIAEECQEGLAEEVETLLRGPEGEVETAIVQVPTEASPLYQRAAVDNSMVVWDAIIQTQKEANTNPYFLAYLQNGALNQRRLTYCAGRYLCNTMEGPCAYGEEVTFSERDAYVCALMDPAWVEENGQVCTSSDLDLTPLLPPPLEDSTLNPAYYLGQFDLAPHDGTTKEEVCKPAGEVVTALEPYHMPRQDGDYYVERLLLANMSRRSMPDDVYLELLSTIYADPTYAEALDDALTVDDPLFVQLYGYDNIYPSVSGLIQMLYYYNLYPQYLNNSTITFGAPLVNAYFLNDAIIADPVGYQDFLERMSRFQICLSRYLCAATGGPCQYGDELEDSADWAAGYTGLVLPQDSSGTTSVCRPLGRLQEGSLYHGRGVSAQDFTYFYRLLTLAFEERGIASDEAHTALYELLSAPALQDAVVEDPTNQALLYHRLGAKAGIGIQVNNWHSTYPYDDTLGSYFSADDFDPKGRMQRCLVRLLCEKTGGPCKYGYDNAELNIAYNDDTLDDCAVDLKSIHQGLTNAAGSHITVCTFEAYLQQSPGNTSSEPYSADACAVKQVLYEYCPQVVTDPENCPSPEDVCDFQPICD